MAQAFTLDLFDSRYVIICQAILVGPLPPAYKRECQDTGVCLYLNISPISVYIYPIGNLDIMFVFRGEDHKINKAGVAGAELFQIFKNLKHESQDLL